MSDDAEPIHSTRGETAGEIAALGLSLVPYVGGHLSELAKSVVARRQSKRLNDFLKNLASDLDALKDRIDKTLGESEDFEDFSERVFAAAEASAQREKLEALRAVFLNTILATPPSYDRGHELVDLIQRLQPRHLVLLRILASPQQANREAGNVLGQGGGPGTSLNQLLRKLLPTWEEEEIARTWETLRREELIGGAHVKAMLTDTGYHQLEGRLSLFGGKVVNYLVNPVSGELAV